MFLLLASSVLSFIAAIYWFHKSAEPRAQQKEMQESARLLAEKARSAKSKSGLGILGLGLAGLSTTGIVTAEAAALHCEKRAWQFCSLALFLAFTAVLITRTRTRDGTPTKPDAV